MAATLTEDEDQDQDGCVLIQRGFSSNKQSNEKENLLIKSGSSFIRAKGDFDFHFTQLDEIDRANVLCCTNSVLFHLCAFLARESTRGNSRSLVYIRN